MPMDDDQYTLLTAKLGYKKEGMSYLDFAAGFEGRSSPAPALLGRGWWRRQAVPAEPRRRWVEVV